MNYLPLTTLIIAIAALMASVGALIFMFGMQKVRKQFFAGKQAASLEEFIINQNKKINELSAQAENIEEAIKELQEQQKLSVQQIGLTRYNPFVDDGGNLSFSMAIMDARKNGVVITSMHGREQNRIYTKRIEMGKSEIKLTDEEQKAIETANQR